MHDIASRHVISAHRRDVENLMRSIPCKAFLISAAALFPTIASADVPPPPDMVAADLAHQVQQAGNACPAVKTFSDYSGPEASDMMWGKQPPQLAICDNGKKFLVAHPPRVSLIRRPDDPPFPPAPAIKVKAVLAASSAAASVKEIFEKHNLLGTFAWDCTKPPSADNNWYFVNRSMDADHVQRDFMSSPTTRAWFLILDKAAETSANEISVSGTRDGKPTESIWRTERNRMLQWDATQDGKKIITGGKWVTTGKDMPWLNRCGD
jgi:hypothetical protein